MKLLYADISGKVNYKMINRGATIIHIKKRYDLLSIGYVIAKNGNEEPFYNLVQLGDSVFSPHGSYSIYVFKDNNSYGYELIIDYEN